VFDNGFSAVLKSLDYPLMIAFFTFCINRLRTDCHIKQSVGMADFASRGAGTFLGVTEAQPESSEQFDNGNANYIKHNQGDDQYYPGRLKAEDFYNGDEQKTTHQATD